MPTRPDVSIFLLCGGLVVGALLHGCDDNECQTLLCTSPAEGFQFETFSPLTTIRASTLLDDDEFTASPDAEQITGAAGPVFLKLTRPDGEVVFLGQFSSELEVKVQIPAEVSELGYELYVEGVSITGSIQP